MATQQFESAKKLILHFAQKNCMNPESDIKGVMPGEYHPVAPSALGEVPPVLDRVTEQFPDAGDGLVYQVAALASCLIFCDGWSATSLGTWMN